MDGLYNRLFSTIPSKDGIASSGGIHSGSSFAHEIVSKDASIVHTLCEWATTSMRSGMHRSFVVAKLLERRHLDIAYMMAEAENHHNALYHSQNISQHNQETNDLKESSLAQSFNEQPSVEDIAQQILSNGPPMFQNQLFLYLDNDAPTLDSGKLEEFSNLILLFYEFICHDVFSHDHYLRALISRGDINGPITNAKNKLSSSYDICDEYLEDIAGKYQDDDYDNNDTDSESDDDTSKSSKPDRASKNENGERSHQDGDGSFDDSKINDDLTNLLNQIKEENQLGDNHDGHGPFSPPVGHTSTINTSNSSENKDKKDSKCETAKNAKQGAYANSSSHDCMNTLLGVDIIKCSRHWQYVYHLPLPQEDSVAANHDMNQRHVLLYGVGKGKDEISKYVKKLLREIIKLFSKSKYAMDVSDGGKVKKHSKSEFNFIHILSQMKALSFHDQLSVNHTCGQAVLEMLNAFAHGLGSNTNYLPVPEYISFLFDLAGMSLNIQGILDWCLQILKELPAIELQLMERSSGLTRTYTTTLALYCVGVLRKYHKILILCPPQDILQVFEVLGKIAYKPKLSSPMGQTGSPIMLDCNSAEWCILAYLYELSNNCFFLKESSRDKFLELKRIFASSIQPACSIFQHTDERFIVDYIANPKKKIDPLIIKLLIENKQNQYNLVCNVLMEVCECNDTDKLNDIAILCCEFTAQCNALSSEWLGALTAICYAGSPENYHYLVTKVSAADSSIYNRLGIFVSILVARHCLQLQSFGLSVAIPSLLKAWEEMKDGNGISSESAIREESEMGARLCCHLLLKLFKTVEPDFQEHSMFYSVGSPSPMPRPSVHSSGIKYSCDRQLLSSAQRNITLGAIIAILKAILVLGDYATDCENLDTFGNNRNRGKATIHEDEENLYSNVKSPSEISMETTSLSNFAKHTLRHICRQEWVRDRCLQAPDDLLRKGILLDQMLSSKQAQKLLRLICAPSYLSNRSKKVKDSSSKSTENQSSISSDFDKDKGNDSNVVKSIDEEQKDNISRILTSIDEWNLRVSAAEIKLMYNQLQANPQSSGLQSWLENAAAAVVDIFQLIDSSTIDNSTNQVKSSSRSEHASKERTDVPDGLTHTPNVKKFRSVWMIPYLVKNLRFLQTKVLKMSCNHLEQGNWSRGPISKATTRHSSQQLAAIEANTTSATKFSIGHQPFLQLVLICLRETDSDSSGSSSSKSKDLQKAEYAANIALSGGGIKNERDEQKENLLQSLHVQLSTFLCFTKDEKLYNYEDPTARKAMQDALQLRFSLVGGMFDTICRSQSSVIEWSTLLVQLIVRGVVDLTHNSDLFTSVLDMLAILIHSTLIIDRDSGDKNSGGSDRTNSAGTVGGNTSTSSVGSGNQTPDRGGSGSGGGNGTDDNRRNYNYHNLVKKLKKEIGDKSNASIKFLRQLLPIPKVFREVIVTEPFGTIDDGKGNKVKGSYSDKKQGLQVSEKQKVSPWDILEGHKNPAPLSWTWFGAVKYERKSSRLEESFLELKYANFSHLEKPNSYFLEAPPLPPEDLEPPLSARGDESKGNDIENMDTGVSKSNTQMHVMQTGAGSHETHGGSANAGVQSLSNVSSPRTMLAIGRGRGSSMHSGGSLGHMQNTLPSGNVQMVGQHQYSGNMPSGQHGGKPMGNMGNIPGVGGNVPMAQMQAMGRATGLMAQRGNFGKKGKTRNVPMSTQGSIAGQGKAAHGVPMGSGAQGGIMNSQGGKPTMGMFPHGSNSMSSNVSGGKPLTGGVMGSGQQWGSGNIMPGVQNAVSGNLPFGAASGAVQSAGNGNYGASSGGVAPTQPPPHYNTAIAQQQMMQNAGAGSSSHMTQGPRFNMNTGGPHNAGAPIGHSGKQALQQMLRARGPSQFMNSGGNSQNVANTASTNQAQFVSPRQNFQGAPQGSNASIQGTSGGTTNRFGNIGSSSTSVGPSTGMNPRMPNQFASQNASLTQAGNNPGNQFNSGNYRGSSQVPSGNSSTPMQNMNSYMMRGPQPGSYGASGQVMMNRQNVMSGNMQGTAGPGGNFMSRIGQNNYMQSPNVNMGSVMQGAGYRNMGTGIPQQAAGPGNLNPQSNMMERMRMQNPQLLAQLQRGPANAPPNNQNQQLGNAFQQNRF